ncbi:unnamed protein product, partial [Prorocentrum cordatum]
MLRPQLERAARNYCFGLKYLLKDTKITDSSPHEVSAGGEPALAATVAGNAAKKEWHREARARGDAGKAAAPGDLEVEDDSCLAGDADGTPSSVAAAGEKDDDEEPEEDRECSVVVHEPPAGELGAVEPLDEEELPSKGSAEHASGNCRRCNFFPK